MPDTRKLVIAVVLIALAAASWWFTRAAPPVGAAAPDARRDPDYIIEKFTGTAMNAQGTPRYRLTAQRLTHYPEDDVSHLLHPVLVQYQPNGTRVTTRADAGVMPGDGSEIVMTGDVHVTRAGATPGAGGEITTEHLRVALDR